MNHSFLCLGSGSVGSARFWLPPDPRGKISTKNCKKKPSLLLNPKSELLKKKRDYKIFLMSEWFIKFWIKIKQKI